MLQLPAILRNRKIENRKSKNRWAKPMLGRCRDLVQHPNHPRPLAAEAADEDDEVAHAFYH